MRIVIMVIVLGCWYIIVDWAPSDYKSSISQRYPLPQEIVVLDTTLPYKIVERDVRYNDEEGIEHKELIAQKVVETKDIDFSRDFKIKTIRYRLVKDDDWFISRWIGFVMSLPAKLFLWDWDVSRGLDSSRARAVLSILENHDEISDLTVRLNHTEAFYDWYRMMTEVQLRERNPFLYRLIFGTLDTVKDEIFAEFCRANYYNPLTKTVVVYSNIESTFAHELGHHIDFERFDTDWVYSLSRILPPIMLYQEWVASIKAKNSLMSDKDRWQFKRYLIPAFFSYIIFSIVIIFQWLTWLAKEE